MNIIFFAIVSTAFFFAAFHQITGDFAVDQTTPIGELSKAIVDSAGGAVELAIGLVGVMTLFLGLMKIAEEGGLLTVLSRLIRPLMVRLFPDVPPDHPAMGAMILNLSANALGLGNAATPFGIKAMQELDRLNSQKGTATNAMALFLTINTSSITLLPTGVIALRAAAGSADPAGILPTTLFATIGSTVIGIAAAKLYQRFASPNPEMLTQPQKEAGAGQNGNDAAADGYPAWVSFTAIGLLLLMVPLTIVYGHIIAPWIIPSLVFGFLAFGLIKKVRIYEVFVEGAKEGFQVAVRIIPYLVAILVAVGMFRASGGLGAMVGVLGRWTSMIGLPAEALPMALLRPLSGSGAYGILASIINDPLIGPDSYTGYLVSTLQGSTETTFYVLAVYFGSVSVQKVRHTLASSLTADLAGVTFAIVACTMFLR
jgi:spore maturation protein SpmA/spore maturation protein SpmB